MDDENMERWLARHRATRKAMTEAFDGMSPIEQTLFATTGVVLMVHMLVRIYRMQHPDAD